MGSARPNGNTALLVINLFDSPHHFFLIGQMIVPGSSYWNIGIGREFGEVTRDEEGVRTMRVLGENRPGC